MVRPGQPYQMVVVESFKPLATAGLHGEFHIRPVAGQGFATNLHVECSKKLSQDYPVGSKFRIRAKLTDREGSGEYVPRKIRK